VDPSLRAHIRNRTSRSIKSKAQIPFALCVVASYLILLFLYAPYIRKIDDQLHQLVQVDLICLLTYAYLESTAYEDATLDPLIDNLISSLLIIVTVCLFILFLIRAFQLVRGIVWYFKRKQAHSIDDRLSDYGRDSVVSNDGRKGSNDTQSSLEQPTIGGGEDDPHEHSSAERNSLPNRPAIALADQVSPPLHTQSSSTNDLHNVL